MSKKDKKSHYLIDEGIKGELKDDFKGLNTDDIHAALDKRDKAEKKGLKGLISLPYPIKFRSRKEIKSGYYSWKMDGIKFVRAFVLMAIRGEEGKRHTYHVVAYLLERNKKQYE